MKAEFPDRDLWGAYRRAALGAVPLAVLIIGIVLSIAGFRLIGDLVRHEARSNFNLLAGRQVSALQQQIERNVETVHALGGLFDASERVSRAEFSVFTKQLISRATGVQALSWNPRISPDRLDDIRRLAREEGMEWYEFFQQDPAGKPQPLTKRPDYVPVLYAEPFESNRGAVGYDVGSDSTRRAALNRARDVGKALSSGSVKLIQNARSGTGFLVFRPVYMDGRVPETLIERRRSIRGYAVGVYRIQDILIAALGQARPGRSHLTIYDGTETDAPQTLIFTTGEIPEGSVGEIEKGTRDGLFHRAQLALPMRTWTIVIHPTADFSSPTQRAASWMFLVAGLLVSFFSFGFVVSVRVRSEVIERKVESRTEELAAEIVERKTVETALQRSERTYAKLAEMAPVGILVFRNRNVDQANLAAATLLRASSPEGLIGRSRQDFLRPEDTGEATRRWQVLVDGATPGKWDVETVRLDGTSFPSVIRTESVDIDGHIYAIVVIEDVSLAQEAEQAIRESEEKYRSLIEFFPQGVLLSEQGNVTQINSAGLALYGAKNAEEILGQDWMSLVEESHVEKMRGRRQIMAEGNSVEPVELEMLRVDGTSFWARSQAMPIHVSGKTFFMTVFADITDRKLAEQEIQRANSELVRSNEELAQFAYVASHDLKEPLRMVSSYCDLIASRYTDKLDESGQKFIYYATDGAKRMQTLIDDLLLYSRVGRGGETVEPVALEPVVDDVMEMISGTIRESGAVVNVGDLPVVNGFRSELARLFQNLIGNAIKFRSDAPLRVDIRGTSEDGKATVTVSDNGIGIAPEYREKIFGVFQRLHSRDKYEGTGIGLAICEKIVEQMGGEIRVEANEGGGSDFVFTVPVED